MAPSMLSILATGVAFGSTALAAASCSKYTVDTTGKTLAFNHYEFLDFRNKGDSLNSYLQSAEFTNAYRISTWTKQPSGANYGFNNLVSNVEMAQNDAIKGETMLSMFSKTDASNQHTAGELESTSTDYYYASVRMGVRVTGASGACAGLFFYHNDNQETDIEILTREREPHNDAETQQPSPPTTSQLHFTNQVNDPATSVKTTKTIDVTVANTTSSRAGTDKIVASGSWEDWNTYRIDWTPGMTYWWSNGDMTHSEAKNTISTPSAWMMNIWSNGDPTWSGVMAPNTQARMDIAWVEIAYNKFSEGAPTVAEAGSNGACALGVGDGTNLNDPASGPSAATGSAPVAAASSAVAPAAAPATTEEAAIPAVENNANVQVITKTVWVTAAAAPTPA